MGARLFARLPLPAVAGFAFAVAALGGAFAFRRFMVDDALITARYAANIAAGHGPRLNAGGPVTDGVTPYGYAWFLSLFARGGVSSAFVAAKWVGVVAWVGAAVVVGWAAARVAGLPERTQLGTPPPDSTSPDSTSPDSTSPDSTPPDSTPFRANFPSPFQTLSPRTLLLIPFLLLATSAPLGAWSGSGMETGVVLAVAALAAALPLLGTHRGAALCIGVAAALRPELLPWAATLGLGVFFTLRAGVRNAPAAGGKAANHHLPTRGRLTLILTLVFAPFVLVAVARWIQFGRPAPLSVFAKSPNAQLGFAYAAACALLAGPVAVAAASSFRALAPYPKALVLSVPVHLLAIALAGGDWMPLSRLMVPILPTIALGALCLARVAPPVFTAVRTALAVAGQIYVLVKIGPTAANVGADRMAVIEELKPSLQEARVVAALDIGWVGASTQGVLVDLAGITDPTIAALPGGHTTKQIPVGLLDARHVDTLVLLLAPGHALATPWTRSRFARGVEAWIASTPNIESDFTPVAQSSPSHLRYVVLRRRPPTTPEPVKEPASAPQLDIPPSKPRTGKP